MTDLERRYIEWARPFIFNAVPFKARGRDMQGIDCWGIVQCGKRDVEGIILPGYTDEYVKAGSRDAELLNKIFVREVPKWDKLPPGAEMAGDVVLMRLSGHPIHVGLVLSKGQMLHIEEGIDVCAESYHDWKWSKRISGIYRHRPQ